MWRSTLMPTYYGPCSGLGLQWRSAFYRGDKLMFEGFDALSYCGGILTGAMLSVIVFAVLPLFLGRDTDGLP